MQKVCCHRAAFPDCSSSPGRFYPDNFTRGGMNRSPALLTTTPESRACVITGITPNCLRLGERDYHAFGSILPLSCLAVGARQRLGLCLSIRLQKGVGYHTLQHARACTPSRQGDTRNHYFLSAHTRAEIRF